MQRAGVLLLAMALGVGAAQAAPRDPRESQARKQCLAGDTQAGVALLADLYADTRNAIYIYSQARCFQQNGRSDEAIQLFREYLRQARDVTPEDRRQVALYIKEVALDRDARARAATAPYGVPVRVPAPSLPPLPPWRLRGELPPPDVELTADPGAGGGQALRAVALVAGAAGMALVGGGVYFGLRARSLERSVERRAVEEGIIDRAERRRGERAVVYQWISYGAGAAALLGGAAAYVLSARDPGGERAIGVAPMLAAEGLGAVVRGAF